MSSFTISSSDFPTLLASMSPQSTSLSSSSPPPPQPQPLSYPWCPPPPYTPRSNVQVRHPIPPPPTRFTPETTGHEETLDELPRYEETAPPLAHAPREVAPPRYALIQDPSDFDPVSLPHADAATLCKAVRLRARKYMAYSLLHCPVCDGTTHRLRGEHATQLLCVLELVVAPVDAWRLDAVDAARAMVAAWWETPCLAAFATQVLMPVVLRFKRRNDAWKRRVEAREARMAAAAAGGWSWMPGWSGYGWYYTSVWGGYGAGVWMAGYAARTMAPAGFQWVPGTYFPV
ncbi:hypothetical protein ACEQ8H_005649 [Pleosporales sp. CAS-2024a]